MDQKFTQCKQCGFPSVLIECVLNKKPKRTYAQCPACDHVSYNPQALNMTNQLRLEKFLRPKKIIKSENGCRLSDETNFSGTDSKTMPHGSQV